MIVVMQTDRWPNGNSVDMIKNGKDYKGSQKYHCHQCGEYGTLNAKGRYTATDRELVLRAYQERVSMRGIQRIFGVVPHTLLKWIEQALEQLPTLLESLMPADVDDILALDELWSFVLRKCNKHWIALCRRTRQGVAYYVGNRGQSSGQHLGERIPPAYKSCLSYSDFWDAYQNVFPSETHQSVGQQSGQTAHLERWNNTLRQRLARFVRKTLSFSKSERVHDLVLRFFIINYNFSCSTRQSSFTTRKLCPDQ